MYKPTEIAIIKTIQLALSRHNQLESYDEGVKKCRWKILQEPKFDEIFWRDHKEKL